MEKTVRVGIIAHGTLRRDQHGVDRPVQLRAALQPGHKGDHGLFMRDSHIDAADLFQQRGQLRRHIFGGDILQGIDRVFLQQGKQAAVDEGGHAVPQRVPDQA